MKIATPISHLFDNYFVANQIIEHTDCLECRDASIDAEFNHQNVFHCELQPIHDLRKKDYEHLEYIAQKKPDLKLITFHAASCCSHPILDGHIFQFGGDKYTVNDMYENARRNFSIIKNIFGNKVKIALENNNYYPTPAYEYITDPLFLHTVVMDNDIHFLLDIAHAQITAYNKTISFDDYLNHLPLERIIQVHLCQYGIDNNKTAYDNHETPDETCFQILEYLARNYPSLRYITIEYYKDVNKLLQALIEVRNRIDGLSE